MITSQDTDKLIINGNDQRWKTYSQHVHSTNKTKMNNDDWGGREVHKSTLSHQRRSSLQLHFFGTWVLGSQWVNLYASDVLKLVAPYIKFFNFLILFFPGSNPYFIH